MLARFGTNPTQITGVISFAAVAVACWVAARRCAPGSKRNWQVLAAIYGAFVVEILFGFRLRIHDAISRIVLQDSLYAQRAGTQKNGLLVLAVLFPIGLALLLLVVRNASATVRLVWIMTWAVLSLFAIEVISLHAIDAIIYRLIGPVMLIGWLWALAALVVVVAASTTRSKGRRPGTFRGTDT